MNTRIFVATDFETITPDEVVAITQWVAKYEVPETVMVMSSQIAHDGASNLTAYKAIAYNSYASPEAIADPVYAGDIHPSAFIKAAEFHYDDFPWPEGY